MLEYKKMIAIMQEKGVIFEDKLNKAELLEIERNYDFFFPESIKEFYSIALPVSKGFYDWRNNSEDNVRLIKAALDSPLLELEKDISDGYFWCEKWGERPKDNQAAFEIMKLKSSEAAKLIPIYSHRYIPSLQSNYDVPVFSVHGSDIIYYGENLLFYLAVEFGERPYSSIDVSNCTHVDFWSDIILY